MSVTVLFTSDLSVLAALIDAARPDLLKLKVTAPGFGEQDAVSDALCGTATALAARVRKIFPSANVAEILSLNKEREGFRLSLSMGRISEVRHSFETLIKSLFPLVTPEELRRLADELDLGLYRSSESIQNLSRRLAYRFYKHIGD
jgi:hypothetical protein